MPRPTRRSFLRLGLAAAAPLALGASLRPGLALAASVAQAFEPFWVQNFVKAELWSGPNARAVSFGQADVFTYFKVLAPQRGPRLYVLNPLTEGTAWIAAAAVGPSGEPTEAYFNPPPPAPAAAAVAPPIASLDLPGRVIGGANLRSRPQVAPDSLLRNLPHNSPVRVLDDVTGGDGEKWYRVGDGQFVHHSLVKLPKSFPPHPGKVIEADLNEPALVTAYEDGKAVHAALAMKGTVAWATPTGFFKIMRRVANETMDSATLGIPRNAPGGYFLRDVLNPLTEGTAWIAAAAVGPSGEPPAAYFNPPPAAPAAAVAPPIASLDLPGRVIGGANLRSRPHVAPDSLLKNLPHNSPVRVLDDVIGTDGEKWYRVGDGQFVHHSLVKLPKSFPTHPGKVIEADLNEPVLVTAYEDGKAVYAALAMKGTVAWATPTGFFKIMRRVANETMDSATLGIPRNAPGGYFLKDVLNTQYFTADGASIHYNWWSSNFGYSGSHGCLGMTLADSQFFWDWGTVGTPLFIHY